MSAEGLFHDAALAAIRADPAFGGVLNGVFEGPAVKATEPFAEIGELMSGDWSTKDLAGRELRTAIIIRDRAESPTRLHALAAAADTAMAGVARDLDGDGADGGAGWRIASLVLLRTRIIRTAPGLWAAMVEHRVRMIEQN